MPEGDTIYRAAVTLHRALAGQEVVRFRSVLTQLMHRDEDRRIAGRTIDQVNSRGKHLLIWFSGDLVLRTHMRMNGSWHIYRAGERWRKPASDMRIAVETAQWVAIAFNVHVAEFHTAASLQRQEDIRHIGPDLLAEEFDETEALRRLRARARSEIGSVLLNQRVLAGAGNVFKSEVLFVVRVNPFTPVGDLSDEQLTAMISTARRLLQSNVRPESPGGIVTYAGLRRTTRRADPSERLWVYGRRGAPCRMCGAAIEYRKQGVEVRGTYWCPECQSSTSRGTA